VSTVDDNLVSKLLTDVGLLHLAEDLDKEEDWMSILSGGEKQKVAFARLLFHSPQFAVLDEATAALSADAQDKLYELLGNSDITFFSIAHRAEVRRFHVNELVLTGDDGGWKFHELRRNMMEAKASSRLSRRSSDPRHLVSRR